MSIKSLILLFCMSFASCVYGEALPSAEMLQEKSLAQTKLMVDPNRLVVAVNGMCCSNCAIGIGKKVSQVKNVDTKSLPKGIEIDRQNGLLTVAVMKGSPVDYPELVDAIRKAGYDPVRLYKLNPDSTVAVVNI